MPLRNLKRRKAFNAPSGPDSSSYVDDAQAPPPRTPKRNRQKSATPELDDEHPDAAQTPPSRKPKRLRKKSPSPSSNSSLDEHQEDKATKSRRDFPTPVSHQAPDDSDDEAAVLRVCPYAIIMTIADILPSETTAGITARLRREKV